MNGILNIICSLSIIFIFWIFTAAMTDASLSRKYPPVKTILLWALGIILLIFVCGILLTIYGVLEPLIQFSSFDILGWITDTVILLFVTLFFFVSSTVIYSGTLSSKLFTASFYAIISLSCADIALVLMKFLLPQSEYYESPYFLGQSGFLILFLVAVSILIAPKISASVKELIESVDGDLRTYMFVPIFSYLSYLAVCCAWNTQPSDFLFIPQIVTRVAVILMIATMYVIVIYSIKKTAKVIMMNNEMKIAQSLQREILPTESFFKDVPNAEISAFIQPYREIGGDFYDVFKIDDDKYGILIADVSGKGIPAALLMMRAKTILNAAARYAKMPAASLSAANREILKNNESCMFLTVFFGVLYSGGRFVYSCAGHNPPLVCRDNTVSELVFRRAPVLGICDYSYENSEIKLEIGDVVFLYTDGIVESVHKLETGEEEMYGLKRLVSIIKSKTSAKEMISAVQNDYKNFTNGAEQQDDVTMLAFCYREYE